MTTGQSGGRQAGAQLELVGRIHNESGRLRLLNAPRGRPPPEAPAHWLGSRSVGRARGPRLTVRVQLGTSQGGRRSVRRPLCDPASVVPQDARRYRRCRQHFSHRFAPAGLVEAPMWPRSDLVVGQIGSDQIRSAALVWGPCSRVPAAARQVAAFPGFSSPPRVLSSSPTPRALQLGPSKLALGLALGLDYWLANGAND